LKQTGWHEPETGVRNANRPGKRGLAEQLGNNALKSSLKSAKCGWEGVWAFSMFGSFWAERHFVLGA